MSALPLSEAVSDRPSPRWWARRQTVLLVMGVFLFARVAASATLGLGDDEAYYWSWSRQWDWSYFEHPGMVAWGIRLSTMLLGKSLLAVRLPTLLWSSATLGMLFALTRRLYPAEQGTAWTVLLLANVVPLMNIGSFFVAPDAPFAFFWVAALWALKGALDGDRRQWYLAGALGGLATLSKYNAVLLPLLLFAYLAASRRLRLLRTREPWIALGLMALLSLPIVVWNADHHWASFAFHLVGRHEHAPFLPFTHLGQFVLAQAGLLSPPLLVAIPWGLLAFRRSAADSDRYLLWVSAFPILFFTALCPFGDFKPHWPAVGFLTGIIAAVRLFAYRGMPRFLQATLLTATTMTALLFGAATTDLVPRLIPSVVRLAGRLGIQGFSEQEAFQGDLTNEMHGWREVMPAVESLARGLREPFVFSQMYQNSAQAEFWGHLETTRLGDRHDEYEVRRDDARLKGRDAIYVVHDKYFLDPTGRFPFRGGCRPALSFPVLRPRGDAEKAHVVRTFQAWQCREYEPGG